MAYPPYSGYDEKYQRCGFNYESVDVFHVSPILLSFGMEAGWRRHRNFAAKSYRIKCCWRAAAAENALPFEPLNPNAETVVAMRAARRGKLIKVGKPDKLLRSLNSGG